MLGNRTVQLIGIIICSCVAPPLTAQNGGISSSSLGKTSAEELRSYGIELSEPSLLAALRNANPRVRALAAHQLQSDRDTDAIPAIERTPPRTCLCATLCVFLLGAAVPASGSTR